MNLTDKELNKLQEIQKEKWDFIEDILKVNNDKAIEKHKKLNWFSRIFTSPVTMRFDSALSNYCWKISKLQTEIEELKSK